MSIIQAASPRQRAFPSARRWRWRRRLPLYFMLLPAFIGLLLFHYYPMYGIIIAFKRYEPLLGFASSPWVGFRQFRLVFSQPDSWEIIRNTFVIAVGKIVLGQAVSITFALLLHQITMQWFKRIIQSLTYILNFLSWMIFGGILLDMLSSSGLINQTFAAIGLPKIRFLTSTAAFPPTMIWTDVWKGFGFGAVIYLAALTGIDPTLYEAASVDGANRWRRMLHITLPGITPTIVLLATLNLGSVLNAGFEQILVLYNPAVYSTADVIDTYVYRAGLVGMQFSLGAAVGLLKGVVSFVLITLSYYLADRLAGYHIF